MSNKAQAGPHRNDLKLPECHGCSKCGRTDDIGGGQFFALVGERYYCRACFFDPDGPGAKWPRPLKVCGFVGKLGQVCTLLEGHGGKHRGPLPRTAKVEVDE